jgi:hypothetical protein
MAQADLTSPSLLLAQLAFFEESIRITSFSSKILTTRGFI